MTLSVIIPATNISTRYRTLKAMIQGGICQGFQIVLVLDEVPEEEEQSLDLREYSDVVVVRGNFGSAGMARNAGLSRANQDWVTFWDCDDWPNAVEVNGLLEDTKRNCKEVGLGAYSILDLALPDMRKVSGEYDWVRDFIKYPGIWRFVFLRKIVEQIRFSNEVIGEDLEFLSEIFARNVSIHISDRLVYTYVVNSSDQLTQRLKEKPKIITSSLMTIRKRAFQLKKSKSRIKKNENRTSNVLFESVLIRLSISLLKNSSNIRERIKILLYLLNLSNFNLVGKMRVIRIYLYLLRERLEQ